MEGYASLWLSEEDLVTLSLQDFEIVLFLWEMHLFLVFKIIKATSFESMKTKDAKLLLVCPLLKWCNKRVAMLAALFLYFFLLLYLQSNCYPFLSLLRLTENNERKKN